MSKFSDLGQKKQQELEDDFSKELIKAEEEHRDYVEEIQINIFDN